MAPSNEESVEAETPVGKIRVRGTDLVAILTLIGVFASVFLMWDHRAVSSEGEKALASAINELSKATRAGNRAQREMNCLISLPQDRREAEFNSPNGLCKRLTAE